MRNSYQYFLITIVVLIAVVVGLATKPKAVKAPVTTNTATNQTVTKSAPTMIAFSTADLPDRDPGFAFRLNIPETWAASYVTNAKAITFYQPEAGDQSTVNLVVTMKSDLPAGSPNATLRIDQMPASTFDDQTEASMAELPDWLTSKHRETYISIKGNSSSYFVFSEGPSVSSAVFDTIVESLHFNQTLPTNSTLEG